MLVNDATISPEMSKYAVIRVQGHQYKVSEGQEILVDKLADTKSVDCEVLLSVDDKKTEIGTPVLKKAKVTLKVIKDMEEGEKIDVVTYKAKSRLRRKKGYRHQYTKLQVAKIS